MVCKTSVAKLSLIVHTPASNAAVRQESASITFSGRHCDCVGQTCDLDWRLAIRRRTISKFAGEVQAPAAHRTIAVRYTIEVAARGNPNRPFPREAVRPRRTRTGLRMTCIKEYENRQDDRYTNR